MTERVRSLERSIRTLTLAVVVLAVLQTWSILTPAERPSPPTFLPSAQAGQMEMLQDAVRPALIITTSQSGANIYEWTWDAELKAWKKRIF